MTQPLPAEVATGWCVAEFAGDMEFKPNPMHPPHPTRSVSGRRAVATSRARSLRLLPPALARLLFAAAILVTATLAPSMARAQEHARGSGGVNSPDQIDRDYVVLISFDAFRWDYLDRGITPNFDRLIRRGTRADGLIPVFPTKTYPNHYSIATGMYAGHHGIVLNNFYDPAWDATYRLSDRSTVEDGRWYGGEPIWVTAEKHGMVSAAMFFIGTEAPVQGIYPTHWNRYVHTLPIRTRLDSVLTWLAMPAKQRPHVITLYFPMTDDAGHRHGPDSPELNAAIMQVDSALGALLDGIEKLPYGDRVNVVAVSDHGMTRSDRGSVLLDDYADLDGVLALDAGPIVSLYFKGDSAKMAAVRAGLDRLPHARAYLRSELPDAWHVKENPRIGDIVVLADEGWLLHLKGRRGETNPATHGYAPTKSMYGIFVAAGPGVKHARIPAFENIHIYPFLCSLLGLPPAAGIDGRADVLAPILRVEPAPSSPRPRPIPPRRLR